MSNKEYRFGFFIDGNAAGGVQALRAVRGEAESLERQTQKTRAATDQWRNSADTLGRQLSNVKGMILGVTGALGLGLSVNFFAGLMNDSIELADHLNDLHKTTSLTVETLAGLNLASKQTGSDLDGTAKAIDMLSRNIGRNSEKFRELGITARDPLEAFKQLSDLFVSIKDPHERAAQMADLIGRNWEAAAPMLAEGSAAIQEMVDRGTRLSQITTEMAENSDEFNDAWAELTASLDSYRNRGVAALLPMLTDLSKATQEFVESGALAEWADRGVLALEALAVVFGARLLPRVLAFNVAVPIAVAESIRYQQALATMAGASTAAATRIGVLNGVMAGAAGTGGRLLAMVGGPFGAAFLVGSAAVYALVQAQKEYAEQNVRTAASMDEVLERIHLMNAGELTAQIGSTKDRIKYLQEYIKALNSSPGAASAMAGTIRSLNLELVGQQEQLSFLERQLVRVNEGWKPVIQKTNDAADATGALTDEYERAQAAIGQMLLDQRTELAQMQMTDRQRAISEALIKAGTTATGEQVVQIIANTNALYDQQTASQAAAAAEKERAETAKKEAAERVAAQKNHAEAVVRANERAAQAAADSWRAFRDSGSDYFADFAMDAESAADAAGKAIERMAYKMAADLALSGLATFFGGKGGGAASLAMGGAGGLNSLFGNAGTAGNIFNALGGGSYLARVATGGKGVVTNAELEQLLGGKSTSTGLNVTDLKNIGLSMGAGIAGSWAGTQVGQGLFGKQAESSWGATAGGAVGAMWGPLGSFIGSAIGGMVDAAVGGDGKKRANAGFLSGSTPGLKDEYNAGEHTFASGLKVTLFARRSDPSAARGIVDVFDQVDRSFVDLVEELGGKVKVSQVQGLDEEATSGSVGTFFGTGGNGTTQGDIVAQLNSYVRQLTDGVSGLDSTLLDSVRSASSAEEALALLTQAVAEKPEKDRKAAESEKTLQQIQSERISLQDQLDELTMNHTQLLEKQRNAIDESNRALFDQVTAARAAKQAESERLSLQQQLDELTLSSGELLARARAAIDPLNHALFDQVQAAKAAKKAEEDLIEARKSFAADMDSVREQGMSRAMSGVSTAFNALQKSVQAERDAATRAFTAASKTLSDSISKMQSLSSALGGTLTSMGVGPNRAAARALLTGALERARSGGPLPLAEALQPALKALSEPSEDLFSTFEEYQRDFWKTANDIEELNSITTTQTDIAETQLEVLETQHLAELARLDGILAAAQLEIDALNGIDGSIKSLAEALSLFSAARSFATSTQQAIARSNAGGFRQVSASEIKAYAQQHGLTTAADLYAAAIANNVDPLAVGGAYGLSAEQTVARLRAAGVPGFSKGTNFVPNDMPAIIHAAERIVPAADNREIVRRLSTAAPGHDELVQEVRQLRTTLLSHAQRTAENTKDIKDILRRVTRDGDGVVLAEG